MFWIHILALLLGGVLAMAGLIVSKKPEAKDLLNKLTPYQAGIGVGLLVVGVINIIEGNLLGSFDMMGLNLLLGLTMLSTITCEVLLGFLLGFGQIAKWIPGETPAEQKAAEMQQKLIKFQTPLGLIAVATALLWLLYRFGVLKMF